MVQEKGAFENIQIVPSKQVRSKYGAIMVWAGALESSKICFRIGEQIYKQAPYETLIEEFPLKLDNIAAYMGLNLSDNSWYRNLITIAA